MNVNINVNGQAKTITHTQLAKLVGQLMAEENLKEGQFVVAINEALVPATAYSTTSLKDGDRIEILTAMVGG